MDTTSTPSRERDVLIPGYAGRKLINVLLVVCKFIAGMLGHSAANYQMPYILYPT